ncbi:hypothetical protein K1X76_12235 [bacterium]|nr:hypothetical protein [bacterium]
MRALKKKRRWTTAFAAVTMALALSLPVSAAECGFADGGYCVDKIFSETMRVVNESKFKDKDSLTSGTILTDLTGGTLVYTNYDALWSGMVKTGAVTEEEKKTAFEEAGKAGGTKIAGVNLVVLGARTLQKLVDLQILTLEDAQKILNNAKEGKI